MDLRHEIAPGARLKPGQLTVEALGIDPAVQDWTRSGDEDGCIEIAMPAGDWERGDVVLLRVGGAPNAHVSVYGRHEWECFLDGAGNGEFDDLAAPDAVCCCAPARLPGFLRTEEYELALMRAAGDPPAVTLPPAGVLLGAGRVRVILAESCFAWRWGTRADRLEQVELLREIAGRGNVDMRVHRYASGFPASWGTYVLLGYPAGSRLLLRDTGMSLAPGLSDEYLTSFGLAHGALPGPGDTDVFLGKLARELE